jgi:hypothetical protein
MLRLASLALCLVWPATCAAGCNRAPQNFAVVLSESLPIPIGKLSEQVILAGQQHLLVLYLDAEGERLDALGLADLDLSPGLRLCETPATSLELHCLAIDEPGLHVLGVSVGDQHLAVPFRTVMESDIVDIVLLQPDEEELTPGSWVQIDVVGVTADGTHVASIHPRFEAGGDRYLGYFAYQYDPDAPRRTLDVQALDRQIRTKFRGVPHDRTLSP